MRDCAGPPPDTSVAPYYVGRVRPHCHSNSVSSGGIVAAVSTGAVRLLCCGSLTVSHSPGCHRHRSSKEHVGTTARFINNNNPHKQLMEWLSKEGIP